MLPINIASAVFPGFSHRRAVELAYAGLTEVFGPGCTAEMQLCPQHPSLLDERAAESLAGDYPDTRFRLHANVRVMREFHKYDASTPWEQSQGYFEQLSCVNRALGGPAYTLHSGRSATADLERMADNVRRIEEVMQVPVGVEGLYPDRETTWLLKDWADYEWLLQSGLKFAIDLSHLNIVAHRTGEQRDDLVCELVSSERCLEVHVSTNRGTRDEHRPVDGQEWWWPILKQANPAAVVFTEGQQRIMRKAA